jgi:hypothetical protein
LRQLAALGTVVLLDYETNVDLDDLSRPLSHAGLIMHYLNGTWPDEIDASQAKKQADSAGTAAIPVNRQY